jgi:hypothetical protein
MTITFADAAARRGERSPPCGAPADRLNLAWGLLDTSLPSPAWVAFPGGAE